MKNIIRRVLNEMTETRPLYWSLPRRFYDELGIRLYDPSDTAYILEVHFDTKDVNIEVGTRITGEYWPYVDSDVPSSFRTYYTFHLPDASKDLKTFILRRLVMEGYSDYL